MLEAKGLTKIYKPKKGVPVTALDHVDLLLPDTGMVFLLGKSGSGKSTLLNLLGGLDNATAGEVIVKGKSTSSFKQKHMDSYRNTYVGFIFQEYNLLPEFNVGANIALALELQGKRATDAEINAILEQVDLAGFGGRKPQELSGGQKQRVAIARALVKNPEIIMADEPTGALDSNTGVQVFDTLKRLSGQKLVVVVSHDREFAERYADRIIELADGKIISDMEYDGAPIDGISFVGNTVAVPNGYHLTEEDRNRINDYIDSLQSRTTLQLEKTVLRAHPTDTGKIKRQDGSAFALIRSKLPLRFAFRMGAGGLKYKKFRLVMTILLSCTAFGLFGLSDTFGAYNHIDTCTNSIIDTDVQYASLHKVVKIPYGNGDYYYSNVETVGFDDDDIKMIADKTGVVADGVFVPRETDLTLKGYNEAAEFTQTDYHIYAPNFTGFCELGSEDLSRNHCKVLAGKLPDGSKNELALTRYVCETFMIGGYSANGAAPFRKIEKPADMVGKTISLCGRTYTVSGVVDTGMDIDRYKPLTKADEAPQSTAEDLVDYALMSELNTLRSCSLHQVAIVGAGHLKSYLAAQPTTSSGSGGSINLFNGDFGCCADYFGTLRDAPVGSVRWLTAPRQSLTKNEVVISTDLYENIIDGKKLENTTQSQSTQLVMKGSKYVYGDSEDTDLGEMTVVGILDADIFPACRSTLLTAPEVYEDIVMPSEGMYSFIVGGMPTDRATVKKLVTFCNGEQNDVEYRLQNAVVFELEAVRDVLRELASVFLWIGIGFAIFAAIMLANFIATSISYKKQEIGILRAIGSRSADVFRIFFAESFVIAMINFVLSATGVGLATWLINLLLRQNYGILITVLSFGIRQIALLFVISCLVAAVASFLPVRRIASKKPIDAIRTL